MTLGGLLVMSLSTIAVLGMLFYCLFKVLTLQPNDENHP